jgi:hypothetical protein
MIALLLFTKWGIKNKIKSLVMGFIFDILIALLISDIIGKYK